MRKLHEIAKEIHSSWGRKVWFGAMPYLQAMSTLDSVDENYGADSGRSIVEYFLSNASTWRGDDARRIKNELKTILGR